MEWTDIALIVITVLLAIGGVYTGRLLKLIRKTGELLTYIADAYDDRKFTKDELLEVLRKAKDVADAGLEIAKLINRNKVRE